MKYLIASDIHGSLFYCEKLIDAYLRESADRLILLGDILYHGPRNDLPEGYDPKSVAALLNAYRKEILCVRGNCEAEVDQLMLSFPITSGFGVLDTGDRVIFLTHGHHFNIDCLPPLKEGDVLLYGHTHIPLCEKRDGVLCLNPGSISLPKNGSPHSYMVYENGEFFFKTLDGDTYMKSEE